MMCFNVVQMKRMYLLLAVLLFGYCSAGRAASQVYFSPHGGTRDGIIKRINRSKGSIVIAVYSLTSGDIAEALGRAAKRGVKIRIVRDYIQSKNKNDENSFLKAQGIEIQIRKGVGRGIMHNKFVVFDNVEACTGSYNWTGNAESYNYENYLCTDEAEVIKSFVGEFEKIWSKPLQSLPQP